MPSKAALASMACRAAGLPVRLQTPFRSKDWVWHILPGTWTGAAVPCMPTLSGGSSLLPLSPAKEWVLGRQGACHGQRVGAPVRQRHGVPAHLLPGGQGHRGLRHDRDLLRHHHPGWRPPRPLATQPAAAVCVVLLVLSRRVRGSTPGQLSSCWVHVWAQGVVAAAWHACQVSNGIWAWAQHDVEALTITTIAVDALQLLPGCCTAASCHGRSGCHALLTWGLPEFRPVAAASWQPDNAICPCMEHRGCFMVSDQAVVGAGCQ